MQQRVALARAFTWSPPALLLDEPFGALDATTRESLNLELVGLWAHHRTTMVFATHSIPEAVFLADRVLVLSSRPASIALDLPIPLSRPRRLELQETADFTALGRQIRSALESSVPVGDEVELPNDRP